MVFLWVLFPFFFTLSIGLALVWRLEGKQASQRTESHTTRKLEGFWRGKHDQIGFDVELEIRRKRLGAGLVQKARIGENTTRSNCHIVSVEKDRVLYTAFHGEQVRAYSLMGSEALVSEARYPYERNIVFRRVS